ncbi:TonB-dependent receptor [Acinetobacter sp. WU_MDCI_Axc73]|nr:TonB-dependent receptor [Acinetobacter sp. WU_MDCI_Axc73]
MYSQIHAQDQINQLPVIKLQSMSDDSNSYHSRISSSATRTETSLQDTPQSITVISPAILKDISPTRLTEALDLAGVGRGNNFGGQGLTNYTVRGFTSAEYFRNGFPINRGYPNAPDSYNVERIDVLRGPASSLYGRTDPGGTFNIISKAPEPERKTVIGANLDSEGLYQATLDTTGAINSDNTLTYRLNLKGENGDAFRDHVESKRLSIAPVIQWTPSDQTKLTFEADILRNQHVLDRGFTRYPNQQVTQFDSKEYWWETGKERNRLYNNNDMLQLRLEHQLDDNWKLNLGGQYLNGELYGYAVEASGLKPDTNGSIIKRNYNWRQLDWIDKNIQANVQGKFNLFNLQHTLVTGIEAEQYDYKSYIIRSSGDNFDLNIIHPIYGAPLPALNKPALDDREELRSLAYFIQDQIDLNDQLKALIGVRYEHYQHEYKNHLNQSQWSKDFDSFVPRVGLVYSLTDQWNVYGNISQSFKPNTGSDRFGQGFDPEKGTSYEIGSKTQFFDDRLSLDSAVFFVKKKNILTPDPVNVNKSVAAGEVESKGFEINLSGSITPQWKAIANYTYSDTEVVKDNTLLKGTRLANIPKNTFNLFSVYEFDSGPLDGLGLGVNQRYISDRKGQTANTTYNMKGYAVTDLIAYYNVSKALRINANVKNIFNKNYDDSAFLNYVYPGQSRLLQVGLTYQF